MRSTQSVRSSVLAGVASLYQASREPSLVAGGEAADVVERYFAAMSTEDLRDRSPEDLHGLMRQHLQLAQHRIPGTSRVSAYAPELSRHGWTSPFSVLDVVVDDAPFLVDSLVMAIRRCGYAVEQIIHPVEHVRRSATGALESIGAGSAADADALKESYVHIEFDRETGAAELAGVVAEASRALADVRVSVDDWRLTQARAEELAVELRASAGVLGDGAAEAIEGAALLHWLANGHFTLLGAIDHEWVDIDGGPDLRPVPGSELGLLRTRPDGTPATEIIGDLRSALSSPILVTKTEGDSTVHRPAPMDIIAIERRDETGRVTGERRLVGLLTSEAYLASPTQIPLVRAKVAEVIARSGLDPRGHDGKELRAILEGHPRDELFAETVEGLRATVTEVLALQERRRVRLLARHDVHRRIWSCLVYLPRDRYTTDVRRRIEAVLLGAFDGDRIEYTATLSESFLARLHFTVHVRNETATGPDDMDLELVQQGVALAVRSWTDDLRASLSAELGEERGRELHEIYSVAFPPAFMAEVSGRVAVADVMAFERMRASGAMVIEIRQISEAPAGLARLKLYVPGAAIVLADVLPVLANFGARVLDERPYEVSLGGVRAHCYDLGIETPGTDLSDATTQATFAEAFAATWDLRNSDDGFNRFVLAAGLTWEQVRVLRSYARYFRQLGIPYSQGYIEAALLERPTIAAALMRLFAARFDPGTASGGAVSLEELSARAAIAAELEAVQSLDQDRIVRTYLAALDATLRTNAYQRSADGSARDTVAIKIDPSRLPEAPLPRPRFEIFVSSPRVEGVHLRMGPVARGGLRWSERPEDFRTEVLGLMKAQAVKNAVIVPAGAKGGFVVRRVPGAPGDRAALQAEVIACYRLFVGALLDITDNRVGGQVVPPERTVRHDGEDPYLVVAADKGTATFSDIANEIAVSRGFWLGDAFASGGSQGYDHKAMAITARGAWESVRQHFRRLGQDPERDDVSVVGIGDMSGDVFGNGMLLSSSMRVIAAFDHRHVFIDPNPDPLASHAERTRLFGLAQSSWADYDTALISPGGGVYARSAKHIDVTDAMRAALGLGDDMTSVRPTELIAALLRAPVDLLWNGGIGTYVKASTETHLDVGDRANDAVRVDASSLRCRVIGEGGNLGLTQRARIEFARAGGLVNTDAIDNSAGVDTSDHEVNLKILLDQVVRDGELTVRHRNETLARLTDEVATHVLQDNVGQNRLLVNALAQAPDMLELHARYIVYLEGVARLDRALEGLPDNESIVARRAKGEGLTSPELAVLVAYTKLHLTEELLASGADDPAFEDTLRAYFPAEINERFSRWVIEHPLRREIIAVGAVNAMVNRNGVTFAFRMQEETRASGADIIRAHTAATRTLHADEFWREVCALDGVVDTPTQVTLFLEADRVVERVSRWFLRNRRLPLDIARAVSDFAAGVRAVDATLDAAMVGEEAASTTARCQQWVDAGVPVALAGAAARLDVLAAALDIVELAGAQVGTDADVSLVASLWFLVDEALHLWPLREQIRALPRDDQWESLARAALRDDLAGEHAAVVASILATTSDVLSVQDRVAAWCETRSEAVQRSLDLASHALRADGGQVSLAPLSVVLRELRTLARAR